MAGVDRSFADCPLRYNALGVTTSSGSSFLRGTGNHSRQSHYHKVEPCRASSINPGQVRDISRQLGRVFAVS